MFLTGILCDLGWAQRFFGILIIELAYKVLMLLFLLLIIGIFVIDLVILIGTLGGARKMWVVIVELFMKKVSSRRLGATVSHVGAPWPLFEAGLGGFRSKGKS